MPRGHIVDRARAVDEHDRRIALYQGRFRHARSRAHPMPPVAEQPDERRHAVEAVAEDVAVGGGGLARAPGGHEEGCGEERRHDRGGPPGSDGLAGGRRHAAASVAAESIRWRWLHTSSKASAETGSRPKRARSERLAVWRKSSARSGARAATSAA